MPRGDRLEGNLFVKCKQIVFEMPKFIEQKTNRQTNDDPGFADIAKGDFRMQPGKEAGIKGFEPIPFDNIGWKEEVSKP